MEKFNEEFSLEENFNEISLAYFSQTAHQRWRVKRGGMQAISSEFSSKFRSRKNVFHSRIFQQTAPKFFNIRTMPKFNQISNVRLKLSDNQMSGIPLMPLINPQMRPHIVAPSINLRKIPPAPPQRQIFRTDPEGMQQSPTVGELAEKKSFVQMAHVQPTNLPRIPPKPFINFGHQPKPNLLMSNQFVFGRALNMPNANLNNCSTHSPKLHFSNQPNIHHANNSQMFHKPKQQLAHKQSPRMCFGGVMNEYAENRAEKSDPENHIYEMIDEYEVSGPKLQVPSHHPAPPPPPPPAVDDDAMANNNLFQDLLRAEMMNQIKSSSKIGNNGFLSHLTQQKRMDIMQETALSLASAAYLEKWVFDLFISGRLFIAPKMRRRWFYKPKRKCGENQYLT